MSDTYIILWNNNYEYTLGKNNNQSYSMEISPMLWICRNHCYGFCKNLGICQASIPCILWKHTIIVENYNPFYFQQDACTGVHSACRREENGHNLDICVLRRLRLRQGQMQGFLGLKVGGGWGLNLQIWGLNRAHETERTVFAIQQVFSTCRRKL